MKEKSMEVTGLIRNTDFEELALRYKRYQESKADSLRISNYRDSIIKQIMESFEFLCSVGKPNYASMNPDEFKIAQQEIKKMASAELQKLEDSFKIFGFLAFIPRWLLRKKIYDYKFKIDHGYSLALNHSDGFETYRITAQTYRIKKLPVNFEELIEQIAEDNIRLYGLISGIGYDDYHG